MEISSKSDQINIGFNMDFQWLNGRDIFAVISPLVRKGLTVLEIHLEPRFPEISDHIEFLCDSASQAGLGLCFHAPYLDPPFMYGFSTTGRNTLETGWALVLEFINRYSSVNDIRTEMVLHGSHGPNAHMDALLKDTVEIAAWILDNCPELTIGIENLPTPRNPSELVKFGEDRDSVLKAVNMIDHPRCGITWDMGHCVRNNVLETPEDSWIQRVVHVHVHDVDAARQDHWPLMTESTPYQSWIQALAKAGFSGTITAELNRNLYGSWSQETIDEYLISSIEKIKSAINRLD